MFNYFFKLQRIGRTSTVNAKFAFDSSDSTVVHEKQSFDDIGNFCLEKNSIETFYLFQFYFDSFITECYDLEIYICMYNNFIINVNIQYLAHFCIDITYFKHLITLACVNI